jgi:hypothetical protein
MLGKKLQHVKNSCTCCNKDYSFTAITIAFFDNLRR